MRVKRIGDIKVQSMNNNCHSSRTNAENRPQKTKSY